jgi:hypothetical protein
MRDNSEKVTVQYRASNTFRSSVFKTLVHAKDGPEGDNRPWNE